MIDDGGAAFPTPPICNQDGELFVNAVHGLSVRDWFAGQALAGLQANPELASLPSPTIAMRAYHFADAMVEERKR